MASPPILSPPPPLALSLLGLYRLSLRLSRCSALILNNHSFSISLNTHNLNWTQNYTGDAYISKDTDGPFNGCDSGIIHTDGHWVYEAHSLFVKEILWRNMAFSNVSAPTWYVKPKLVLCSFQRCYSKSDGSNLTYSLNCVVLFRGSRMCLTRCFPLTPPRNRSTAPLPSRLSKVSRAQLVFVQDAFVPEKAVESPYPWVFPLQLCQFTQKSIFKDMM